MTVARISFKNIPFFSNINRLPDPTCLALGKTLATFKSLKSLGFEFSSDKMTDKAMGNLQKPLSKLTSLRNLSFKLWR